MLYCFKTSVIPLWNCNHSPNQAKLRGKQQKSCLHDTWNSVYFTESEWHRELFHVCTLNNRLATSLLLCSMHISHIFCYPWNSSEMSNEKDFTASQDSHWIVTALPGALLGQSQGNKVLSGWSLCWLLTCHCLRNSSRWKGELKNGYWKPITCKTFATSLCVFTTVLNSHSIAVNNTHFFLSCQYVGNIYILQRWTCTYSAKVKGIEFAWINMSNMPWHQLLAAGRE